VYNAGGKRAGTYVWQRDPYNGVSEWVRK
jgi:hypothetical protein